MFKVIVKVIIALLLLGYAAFFMSWNMTAQQVVSWDLFGYKYTQTLPMASLGFVGLFLGAIVMAASCWSAWATQKSYANKATATVKKAKVKLQAQLDMIHELRAEIERLEGELESLNAGDGTWGVTGAPAGAAHAAETVVAVDADAEVVDDDEVI